MTTGGRTTGAEKAVLATALVLGLTQALLYQYYYVDDTFITLRYLKNLLDGYGLCFNPGERAEGYSCFGWIVLLALPARVLRLSEAGFPDTFWLARALGTTFGLATLVALYSAARTVFGPERRAAALAAPLWLAVSVPFWVWTSSGMETPLFAFLVTLALYRFMAETVDPEARPASALLLVLASMTRPEGPLYFIALAFHRITGNPRVLSDKHFHRWLLLFAVPYGAYFIWRFIHFGHIFPTSVVAKAQTDSAAAIAAGATYLFDFARNQGGAIVFLPALIPLFGSGFARRTRAAAAAVAAGIALILVSGGDWMFYFRFMVPVLPALILPAVAGYHRLIGYLVDAAGSSPLRSVPRRVLKTALAALAGLLVLSGNYYHDPARGGDMMYDYKATWTTWTPRLYRLPIFLSTAWLTPVKSIDPRLAADTTPLATWIGAANAAAAWIERQTDESALLATTVAGYIPFRTGLPTIDMLGLNDIAIARLYNRGRYEELVDRVYAMNPAVVVLTVTPESIAGTAAEPKLTDRIQELFYADPRFAARYKLGYRAAHYLVFRRTAE